MKKTWNTQKCHLAFISLFIVTLLLFSAEVSGKNYYFSSSNGDDSRTPTQAQDPVTPWKTIDKLNSFFSSILPGDSVLFKKGDSFYGSIQIKKSGTSTLPIVIGAYGTGENPIITAFQTVIGWTNLGGNIWESSATNCNPTLNMVTIDGAIAQLGRYPNSTFLTYESFSGTSSITDNQLTATPNWTGAEVVIRTSSYNAVRQLITNHNSNTITYSGGSTTPTANFGYFIQKDPKTLDTTGEWYLKTSTKKLQMYFGNNNPNTYIIKASALDTLLYCKDINYITVSNINFEGANAYGIHITRGTGIVISNCEMNLNGGYGIYSISNTNFKMQSCTILNSLHTGAMIGGINSVVSHNTIRRSGLIIGRNMGSGGYHGIEAINVPGNIVEYNTIDSSGRDGLFMKGINSISRYNIITYFGLTLDDCGGIYTSGTAMTGRKIYNNIILYGIGNRAGAVGTGSSCEGIYLDEPITGVEVTGNTVAHCGSSGLRYHNAYNIVARENTLYDNTYNIHIIKSNAFAAYSRNLTFKSNISVCKTLSQFAFRIYNYISDDPLLYGTSDSNYFCRPIADTYTTQTKVISASTSRTLEGWQAFSIQDMNSKKSPATIIDVQDILFEYNASLINKVVLLNATYLGVDSTLYNNSITLLPYTSIVLIKIPGSDKNQMPSILNQNFQLNENSVNATTVGTVIATDPDTGQTKT
ncbi:MAG: right-handed parallel beta-helix repeat-containing protein, partial [Candidatus Saccharimonadaceae bacterium]